MYFDWVRYMIPNFILIISQIESNFERQLITWTCDMYVYIALNFDLVDLIFVYIILFIYLSAPLVCSIEFLPCFSHV